MKINKLSIFERIIILFLFWVIFIPIFTIGMILIIYKNYILIQQGFNIFNNIWVYIFIIWYSIITFGIFGLLFFSVYLGIIINSIDVLKGNKI